MRSSSSWVFLVFCLSLTQIQVSSADLVDDTCKQTPHPDLCENTLRADPKSGSADVAGLGTIMVGAVRAKATATVDEIKTLLGKENPDPKTKVALNNCVSKYNAILNGDVPAAMEALQKGNPKVAEEGMNDASNEADWCERAFGGGTSSPITSSNKSVTDLSRVASAIIKLLL